MTPGSRLPGNKQIQLQASKCRRHSAVVLALFATRRAEDTPKSCRKHRDPGENIMRTSKWNITGALAILAFISAADAQTVRPALDSIEAHLAAGKNAAGGRDDTPDFYGLVTRNLRRAAERPSSARR